MDIVYQVTAGILSGIMSGMGFGGGVILIPVLTLLLGFGQKSAQGMNLLYFIPTGAAALWVHIKNKNIEVGLAWAIAAYGVIGAFCGASLAYIIPADILRRVFGALTVLVGANEFYRAKKYLSD